MNTLPLINNPWESKKVITLIIQDGIYQPVVNTPSEEREDNQEITQPKNTKPTYETWKKVKTYRRGKEIITEEVIVISDTDEDITSVKLGPVIIQPQQQVEQIPHSPPP